MNPDLTNKLISSYPKQFKNLSWIECGDGWYDLLDKLCNTIQERLDYNLKQGRDDSFFWWSQIKEKFGGLRAYCYGADEYMRGAISMAESISYGICEVTGEKGKLRKEMLNKAQKPIPAWMKTLSDTEAKKEGYIV